jgi:hypothetical protein
MIGAPQRLRPSKLRLISAVLLGIVLGSGFFLPLRNHKKAEAKRKCIANLKQIDGATAILFLEHHGPTATTSEIPTDQDLFGPTRYIPKKLSCPAGGIYTYGWVFTNHLEKPRCSIPGHTI